MNPPTRVTLTGVNPFSFLSKSSGIACAENQIAIKIVAPCVIGTSKQLRGAIFFKANLRSAVPANIRMRFDRAAFGANDNDRLTVKLKRSKNHRDLGFQCDDPHIANVG